jgi:NAD(P)-dependent dehydrogenase (short-subunit alcohol dehydrogenase family)
LFRSLANEWAPLGITVDAIAPGYIATNNDAGLRADVGRARFSVAFRRDAGVSQATSAAASSSSPRTRPPMCRDTCSPWMAAGWRAERTISRPSDTRMGDRTTPTGRDRHSPTEIRDGDVRLDAAG